MDKPALDKLRATTGLGLRLIDYFLLKMVTLLIQGIVQKCSVNMKGDKAGGAIVIRYGNAEVGRPIYNCRDLFCLSYRGGCVAIFLTEPKSMTQGSADRHQTCVLGRSPARWTTVPTRMLNVCGSLAAAA